MKVYKNWMPQFYSQNHTHIRYVTISPRMNLNGSVQQFKVNRVYSKWLYVSLNSKEIYIHLHTGINSHK